jgi:diguanylate cyclase (GGDEF)-like protein
LTGLRAEDLIGHRIGTAGTLPLLPDAYLHGARHSAPRPFVDHTFELTLPDGRAAVLLSKALPAFDIHSHALQGFRGTVTDVTIQHRLAAQSQHQATHDDLTDLVNRREFERRLEGLLSHARSHGSTHAMCYIDLDQFKAVNDGCGHAAGDALLRRVAGDLRRRLRSRDTLARLGGDEFGVLLEHCAAADAVGLAAQLHACIEAIDFVWQGHEFRITASVGVTLVDARNSDLDSVMMDADAACYAAKNMGRNRVHLGGRTEAEATPQLRDLS